MAWGIHIIIFKSMHSINIFQQPNSVSLVLSNLLTKWIELKLNYAISLDRWFKDGKLLTDLEKFQTYRELRSGVLVLVIKNPGERDLGQYECEVWRLLL